jgi:hypothetical protein
MVHLSKVYTVLGAFASLATGANAATSPSLRGCLTKISGMEVVTSTDSAFATARQAFDLRFTYVPQAVVVRNQNHISFQSILPKINLVDRLLLSVSLF